MASRYEVEVAISSAKDLKNINWRHGPLRPYAVVWVDSNSKCSTMIDEEGDTFPLWNQTLVIPFKYPIEDSTLHIDIVHANAAEDIKPLIGSARLPLRDIVDEFGLRGEPAQFKLDLKRPSGRPHGKLEIKVSVREPRYRAPEQNYPPQYGVPTPASRAYYAAPQPYGNSYAAPPPPPYGNPYAAPPPVEYYGGAPYGQPGYGQANYGQPASYGQYAEEGQKKSKSGMGMGTGLAVGAVAGVLGGLALAEGVDYVEDKIADDAADKVEDDLGYDDDDY